MMPLSEWPQLLDAVNHYHAELGCEDGPDPSTDIEMCPFLKAALVNASNQWKHMDDMIKNTLVASIWEGSGHPYINSWIGRFLSWWESRHRVRQD
jgi:hypothetical protein